jgi:hypothetical protein
VAGIPGGQETYSIRLVYARQQDKRCEFLSWSSWSVEWLMMVDVMLGGSSPSHPMSWKEHDLVLKPVVTSGTSIFFETSKWLTTTRTKWIIHRLGDGHESMFIGMIIYIHQSGISVLSGLYFCWINGMDMDG